MTFRPALIDELLHGYKDASDLMGDRGLNKL